jgi:hypothetical protein
MARLYRVARLERFAIRFHRINRSSFLIYAISESSDDSI